MSNDPRYTHRSDNTRKGLNDDEIFDPQGGPSSKKSSRQKLYIIVKQSGSSNQFGVSIRGDNTIAELKAKIEKDDGYKNFDLQDGDGNYFDDDETVDGSGIEDRDVIIMELN